MEEGGDKMELRGRVISLMHVLHSKISKGNSSKLIQLTNHPKLMYLVLA